MPVRIFRWPNLNLELNCLPVELPNVHFLGFTANNKGWGTRGGGGYTGPNKVNYPGSTAARPRITKLSAPVSP